jgi:hypothetical protein
MINSLSELYTPIIQQLPGASLPTIINEFRRAERKVCVEASIWNSDLTFDLVAATYEYSIDLPANADLVQSRFLLDENGKTVDVNDYQVTFGAGSAVTAYQVNSVYGIHPSTIEETYTDSGETLNSETVYANASDTFVLCKAVDGLTVDSDLYILTSRVQFDLFVADPQNFPDDYYAIAPPLSTLEGVFVGEGDYSGELNVSGPTSSAIITYILDEKLVTDDLGTFSATINLAPTTGYSSLGASELTVYADLITQTALLALLRYPRTFPWPDPVRANEVEQEVRRLRSIAKQDNYRKFKRATLKMDGPSFI